MAKYVLFIILIAWCPYQPVSAQRQLKAVRSHLKNKNGSEALKLVAELEKDSVLRTNPRLYDLGKQAQIIINNSDNEKIYLKQAYDTVRFFNSTYGIIEYILKCEQAEQAQFEKEGKKIKYHRENGDLLHLHFPNIEVACRYWYSKQKYAEAAKFLKMYLTLPHTSVWGKEKTILSSKKYSRNASLYLISSYEQKDYDEMKKYKEVALEDSFMRRKVLYCLTLASQSLKEEKEYKTYLCDGLKEFPTDPFFFTNLTDYYTQHGDYNSSLLLADTLLDIDSVNLYFLEAKTVALLNLGRNEEAILSGKRILQVDSSFTNANYYIGAAYCNMAKNIELPTNINSKAYKKANAALKEYYAAALPYLEQYRNAAPQETKRWAPLLYRIYLSLNKGKQFEEIDKLLKTL